MAYQAVDIGAAPNDGTGDPLRDAFDKINDNFVELYAGLAGLLDFKGSTDCSANPNYPAASKGDFYLVSVAGKIGGGSGISVQAGDTYFALADNAGGTQASVGSSWTVIQGNIVPTTVGGNLIGVTDPSAITFLRVNADNSVSLLSASAFRTAIGAGTGSGSGDMIAANNLSDVVSASTSRSNLSAAAKSQTGEQISGFIASPSNKSYTIALDMKHAGTITEVTTKSASGTCTATWKINSTALGGTANSVSSSETTQSHASSNAFAAGDDIVLTVSSNSSCADMSFTIKYTRTLA